MKLFKYIKLAGYVFSNLNSLKDIFYIFKFRHFFYIWRIKNNVRRLGFKIKRIEKDYIIFSNSQINCMVSIKYPWVFNEVFSKELYKFHDDIINSNKKYAVFDIGANRGYTALYFATKPWCNKIYSFELFPQIYAEIKKNLDINNKDISQKIKSYNFGLSNKNTNIIAYLLNRESISGINKDFLLKYAPEEINNGIKTVCEIKRASEILKQIIELEKLDEIILKIDVEGSEYEIFDDLIKYYPEIFDKVVKIVGEVHLGFDKLYDKLKIFGYDIVWKNIDENNFYTFELSKK